MPFRWIRVSVQPICYDCADIPRPDILALGVQEIVPLTAQQIVQTDISKKYVYTDGRASRLIGNLQSGI
jgi:hypothetical protein